MSAQESYEHRQHIRTREWLRLAPPATLTVLVWASPPAAKPLLLALFPVATSLWVLTGLRVLPGPWRRALPLGLMALALIPGNPVLQIALSLAGAGSLYVLERHSRVAELDGANRWRGQMRGTLFSYLLICHLATLGFVLNPYS